MPIREENPIAPNNITKTGVKQQRAETILPIIPVFISREFRMFTSAWLNTRKCFLITGLNAKHILERGTYVYTRTVITLLQGVSYE